MSRFTQLMTFIKVVEEDSFILAAQQLHISNTAVSKQIKQLESSIGQTLLNRSTRSLSLTELEREFYTYCKKFERDMQSANDFIDAQREKPQGELKILSSVFFYETFLRSHLVKFRNQYPFVRIKLEINDRTPISQHDNFDIIVGYIHRQPIPEEFICRKLYDFQYALCAAPAYIKRHGLPKVPADLCEHTFIANSMVSCANNIRFKNDTKVVTKKPEVFINNVIALKRLCCQGTGILRINKEFIKAELDNGSLIQILPDYPLPEHTAYLFYQAGEFIAPKLHCFINYLLEYFSNDNVNTAKFAVNTNFEEIKQQVINE